MKLSVTRTLIVVNAGLAAALAWLWLNPDGSLRNTRWEPPTPVSPALSSLLPALPSQASAADISRFVATLDRPLFSPTRRPPIPPPPPAPPAPVPPPPPPDPLADVQLSGVFSGADGGGVILKVEGKNRLVRVNEQIGAWTVKAINDRDVTFARGAETRVLKVERLRAAPPPPSPIGSTPAAAGAPMQAGQAQAGQLRGMTGQAVDDYLRNRRRIENEARAKAGLPLVPN